MIRLTISGTPHSFPRDWNAAAALARLGYGSEFALRKNGTDVGPSLPLGDLLSDGDELELVRL